MIHKAGLLIMRDNRILLCRKQHTTSLLILPGGKMEPDEPVIACIHREIREELGDVSAPWITYLGTYQDQAAGMPDEIVEIVLFEGDLVGEPRPQAEIAELVWFGKNDDRALVSPSIRNRILPDLIKRGLLDWEPERP